MNNEIHYRVLKMIEAEPQLTQRALASRLGISLGKANYCLQALMEKGLIKARNFKNSDQKMQYMYILTPKGARQKTLYTYRFLKQKAAEYEDLKREIEDFENGRKG